MYRVSEIYFSQIKEDSRLDREVLNDFNCSKVMAIGSGGCTAFSLLTDSVDEIHAVDANPAQCAVIELKQAAIEHLEKEEYTSFLGEVEGRDRRAVYKLLRDDLSSAAKRFWDKHPGRISRGINYSGATERFYKFVGDNLRLNVCNAELIDKIQNCSNIDEQKDIYYNRIKTPEWDSAFKILFSRTSHLPFYPAFWFTGKSEQSFSSFVFERLEHEINNRPLCGNYFFSQLFNGRYQHDKDDGMPPYLVNYDTTKKNIRKLKVVNSTLQKAMTSGLNIDGFFLSNVFDWGKQKDTDLICDRLLKSMSPNGAALFYRNMYDKTKTPDAFSNRYETNLQESKRLFARERSMLYRFTTVGQIH